MSEQGQLFTCAGGVPAAYPLFHAGGGGSTPTSALQLRFQPTSVDFAARMNARWHSVLPYFAVQQAKGGGQYGAAYIALHDGACYAAAIWSSPPALNRMTADPDAIIELRRLAICADAPKNTASRMLAWMVRNLRQRHPALSRFISYQAKDHHTGTIYRAAGWIATAVTEFQPWLHHGGSPTQTSSEKVRWERVFP